MFGWRKARAWDIWSSRRVKITGFIPESASMNAVGESSGTKVATKLGKVIKKLPVTRSKDAGLGFKK